MITRRKFVTSGATFGLAVGLSACKSTPKHLLPVSENARVQLASNGVMSGSPVYIRIFKKEEEMEVWLHSPYGYVPFKTYKICSWSGGLGPKLKEGDKQAPEGFYMVSKTQMNPNSKYHLSFNMGYPNAYDRAYERTGAHLMVHGGCRSAGCYAMTDDNVQEIYALARDAFLGGQREFPVHAFPFRLTAANLHLNRNHKWAKFWRNLKTGYDHFELHARPPVVAVKNKRYVFFDTEDQVPKIAANQSKVRVSADQAVLITGWASASLN